MDMNHTLTIAIPTFNRVGIITQHVNYLISESVHELVEILIIDNGSPDGTYDRLREISNGTPIRVLRNPENIGFNSSFYRLFHECNTEYLIIMSDEDLIIPEQLTHLAQFLQQYQPLFVSSQIINNQGEIFREFRDLDDGDQRTDSTHDWCKYRQISPSELYEASGYISGLVYKREESIQALHDIKPHVDKPGQIYPQILLTAQLVLRGPCYYWKHPLAQKKHFCLSSVDDDPTFAGKHNQLRARWKQHKLFLDFYADKSRDSDDPVQKKMALQMLQAQKERLVPTMMSAVRNEFTDLEILAGRWLRKVGIYKYLFKERREGLHLSETK
jgi:hypothetical protein